MHPNTVRYRLRRVSEVTGWDPLDPREAYVLQTASGKSPAFVKAIQFIPSRWGIGSSVDSGIDLYTVTDLSAE